MLGVSDLIATAENTLVASKAYAIGDVFTANGKLYKATAAIAANDSIILQNNGETVSGANAVETAIENCLKEAKTHNIVSASVGQTVKIAAVDANGTPTAWEPVDIYPKKVFDITSPDNYNLVDVLAIDYATGELTISENDSEITDDYATTVTAIPIPVVSGAATTFRVGMIPIEIWNQAPDLSNVRTLRAVSTGDNKIKLYSAASTSIDSFTESSTIDLTRFKLLIKKSQNTGNPVNYVYSNFDISKSYKIRLSSPYTMRDSNSFKIDGFGNSAQYNGYAARTIAPSQYNGVDGGIIGNAKFFIEGTNAYETFGIRYFKRWWSTQSPCIFLPFIAEAVLSKISDNAWTLSGKYVTFESEDGLFTNNKRICTVEQTATIYSQTPPININSMFGVNGTRLEIWELGDV